MLDRIKHIAEINGHHTVIEKAKEELGELIEAIDENDKEHISEEIADTLIMAFELMHTYDNENKVYDWIDFKLDRTEKLLGVVENE